jgi:hypothetical protein
VPPERPEIALQREHGSAAAPQRSTAEHAALCMQLDAEPSNKALWALYERELEARLSPL